MSKFLASVGILLTAIYGFVLFFLVASRVEELSGLSLNELGDFLAGAFGPIAILWLILGFFQQGVELKQNTEALHLQAKELKNSVEQQKALVELSRNQFQAELETIGYERALQRKLQQPNIVFTNVGRTISRDVLEFHINFINGGNPATNLVPAVNRETELLSPDSIPNCPRDYKFAIYLRYKGRSPVENTVLTLNYIDGIGAPGDVKFQLTPAGSANDQTITVHKIEN